MTTISAIPSPSSITTKEDPQNISPISQNPLSTIPPDVAKKRSILEVTPDINTTIATIAAIPPSNQIPAKKKPKLTEEEKEEKRREKEAKEFERELKEQEKRRDKELKEKEREAKKAEKEAKKRTKEEEKRKKDDEKRKRDEEKAKKERAQLRLNKFFKKPGNDEECSITAYTPVTGNAEITAEKASADLSEYNKSFHPFFIKPNVELAPISYHRDPEAQKATIMFLDRILSSTNSNTLHDTTLQIPIVSGTINPRILDVLDLPLAKRGRRGFHLIYTMNDLLARVNSPDDFRSPSSNTLGVKAKHVYDSVYYLTLLNALPNKFLKFAEDVRPPYNGTFTRTPQSLGLRKGRKPFEKSLPGVNYDYDSEAEWVADEDGEDLISEDEDDKDSVGDSDDLEGFLDDEDDSGLKRNRMGILVPTNSGMCWQNDKGVNERIDLEEMKIQMLLDGVSGTINPFTTSYWEPASTIDNKSSFTGMEPPRRPFVISSRNVAPSTVPPEIARKDPARKIVSQDDMEAFKRAIEGSDMTKTGLIEVLKKAFPKIGKDAIRNTIDLIAERVGEKRDDKRWVLK